MRVSCSRCFLRQKDAARHIDTMKRSPPCTARKLHSRAAYLAMRHCGGAERLRFIPISKDAFGFTSAINHTSFSTGKFQIKVDRFAKALYNSICNRIACITARKRRLIKAKGTGCESRTIPVTVKRTDGHHVTAFNRGKTLVPDEAKSGDLVMRHAQTGIAPGKGNMQKRRRSYARLCFFCRSRRGTFFSFPGAVRLQ